MFILFDTLDANELEIVESGGLGPIIQVHCYYGRLMYTYSYLYFILLIHELLFI